MKCKNCDEEMMMEGVGEKDGTVEVLFKCGRCGLGCQGYYNPEHQTPDPIFWSDE